MDYFSKYMKYKTKYVNTLSGGGGYAPTCLQCNTLMQGGSNLHADNIQDELSLAKIKELRADIDRRAADIQTNNGVLQSDDIAYFFKSVNGQLNLVANMFNNKLDKNESLKTDILRTLQDSLKNSDNTVGTDDNTKLHTSSGVENVDNQNDAIDEVSLYTTEFNEIEQKFIKKIESYELDNSMLNYDSD